MTTINNKLANLQSRTKLLEKVFPIMSTLLRNKTISKTKPLRKENPFPQFNVASHKRPGIRLSFEYTTTLLSGEGGEGRTGTATMFRKMLSKYTIFSTVLSKIVAIYGYIWCSSCDLCFLIRTNTCVMKWSENVMSFNIKHDCKCHSNELQRTWYALN